MVFITTETGPAPVILSAEWHLNIKPLTLPFSAASRVSPLRFLPAVGYLINLRLYRASLSSAERQTEQEPGCVNPLVAAERAMPLSPSASGSG